MLLSSDKPPEQIRMGVASLESLLHNLKLVYLLEVDQPSVRNHIFNRGYDPKDPNKTHKLVDEFIQSHTHDEIMTLLCESGTSQKSVRMFERVKNVLNSDADDISESVLRKCARDLWNLTKGKISSEALSHVEIALAPLLPCKRCQENFGKYSCSRCRRVDYCSKKCQKQDWKSHKKDCCVSGNLDGR